MKKKKYVNQFNVTKNLTIDKKNSPHNCKPYDDRKVMPGEVLAPMLATEDRIKWVSLLRTEKIKILKKPIKNRAFSGKGANLYVNQNHSTL